MHLVLIICIKIRSRITIFIMFVRRRRIIVKLLRCVVMKGTVMVDKSVQFTKDELKWIAQGMAALRGSNARMIAKGGEDELVGFYKKRDQQLLNLINKIGSMEIFP